MLHTYFLIPKHFQSSDNHYSRSTTPEESETSFRNFREGREVEAGVVQEEEAEVAEEEEGPIWLQSIELLLLIRQERQGLLSLR